MPLCLLLSFAQRGINVTEMRVYIPKVLGLWALNWRELAGGLAAVAEAWC